MGRHSDQDNSSKAVIWIVLGVVGGLTFFGALLLVVGILAYRNLGTSPNTTYTKVPAPARAPIAKVEPAKQSPTDVGKVAPEIEGQDFDGKSFKLSDYRGKVVMLDFWGNWWPPCRAMYPHERSLVQKMQGKPFTLLGVNSDTDREELKESLISEQITWRSFMAGGTSGPIPTHWQVHSWPTIFIIDHKGVIRYKHEGNPGDAVLDREIEQLVKQAETQKSS